MPTPVITPVGNGRFEIRMGPVSPTFIVRGTAANATWWAQRLELAFRNPTVLQAMGMLNGREFNLINATEYRGSNIGMGRYFSHRRNAAGLTQDWPGVDGEIVLDVAEIENLSRALGNSAIGEVAAYLAHEFLHAAFGSHVWPRNVTWQNVYSDPFYAAQTNLAADLRLAVQARESYGAIPVGAFVVSSRGIDTSTVNIQTDSAGRAFYTVGNKTYFVVSHEDYARIGAVATARNVNRARQPNGAAEDEFGAFNQYAGTEAEAAAMGRAVNEVSRAVRSQSFAQAGSVIGSALGSALSNGDRARGVLYSSLLGEIGERLGAAIGYGGTVEDSLGLATSGGLGAFGSEVAVRAGAAAIGTVSSWLSMELGEALGLEGFGAELFTTVGSTVTNTIIGNLLTQGSGFAFQGISTQAIGEALGGATRDALSSPGASTAQMASALASAVGAFIGAKLGALVVNPQTQAAVVLSSVGSAVGAFMGTKILGGWAAQFGKYLGAAIAPGIGAFVGFVIGALIGNLFGRKQKPKVPTANASTYLDFTVDEFVLGNGSAANGGDLDVVRSMATAARDTLNGFLTVLKGDFSSETQPGSGGYAHWSGSYYYAAAPSITFGHSGSQLWLNANYQQINVASADVAVEKGVMWALSQVNVVGGDIIAKRAVGGAYGQDLAVLLGNLQIASDYRFYGENRELINGYITEAFASLSEAEQSFYAANKALIDKVHMQGEGGLTSAEHGDYLAAQSVIDKIIGALDAQSLANPWIITLQRASELGLDKFRASDFNGGLQGFLMSFDLRGHAAELEQISLGQVGQHLRISLPANVGEGLFGLLSTSTSDGRALDISNFFGANTVGYSVGVANTSGRDFIDRRGETAGVTISDFRSQYISHGYWYNTDGWYAGNPPPMPPPGVYPSQSYPGWAWVNDPQYETQTGGDDIFLGGSGNDLLEGHAGWDWLDGGAGDDVLVGGEDNDVLLGGDGQDTLNGDAGDDYLAGGGGHDLLQGGVGDDLLVGGAGFDQLYGGEGNDRLLVDQGDGAQDILEGGAGRDALSFERWNQAVVFSMGQASDTWGYSSVFGDIYTGIENVIGSAYGDKLWGDHQANELFGGAGSDVLNGGAGDDVLEGGADADVLNGGSDVDTASYAGSRNAVFVDLTANEALGGDATGDTFVSIENLEGSRFNDDLKGDAGANRLSGGEGDDWIVATRGADVYDGGEGLDTADYSTGFASGVSTTQVWVETGYWVYPEPDPWNPNPWEPTEPTYPQEPGGGQPYWVSTGGYYETQTTTVHGLNVAGGVATWRAVDGSTGSHSLVGIEHIVGTAGSDYISMTAGDDFLTGAAGNDFLTGGSGADTFYFSAGDGIDNVFDTNVDANAISFSSEVGFNSLSFGYGGLGASGYLDIYYGAGDQVRVNGNFGYQTWNGVQLPGVNTIKVLDMAGMGQLDLSTLVYVIGGGTSAGNTLYGYQGYGDLIAGYGGDDYIDASGGSHETSGNVIIGGAGNDTIVTSAGDDQFAFERGSGRDTIHDAGGEDTIVFGPNVTANDVIYKVVGNDLYVGIAEAANPSLEAHQVTDHVRVVNGAIRYQNVSTGAQSYAGVEFINAGGSWIDLRKLSIDWVTSYTSGWPPIVLDLQGDGLDVIGVSQSKVVSRLDSGYLARTSWVGPTDAFLAVDRNGDGQINRTSEISFLGDKAGAKTDLEGLQAWDSNGDGKITAADEGWSKFRIWTDVNQNGRSTASELKTLDEIGIVEINLTGTPTGSSFATSGGETFVHNTLSFTWASGATGTAYDVELGRQLIGADGLDLDALRAAWGDGLSDAELGRLISEPQLPPGSLPRPWSGRDGDRPLTVSEDPDARYPGEDIELGFGRETTSVERADFSDHDNLFAEDLERQRLRERAAPGPNDVDADTRAALRLLTDGLGRDRFSRPEWELGGGQGDSALTLSDAGNAGLGPRIDPRQKLGGLEQASVRAPQLAGMDPSRAAEALSMDADGPDAWAAAPITLAQSTARQRWWVAPQPVGEAERILIDPQVSTGGYSIAPEALADVDPATLSAHQQLTQALAVFGAGKGAGAAVWKRSGEGAEVADTAADARHARWNFGSGHRMAG